MKLSLYHSISTYYRCHYLIINSKADSARSRSGFKKQVKAPLALMFVAPDCVGILFKFM